jgi:hypothetical protein
MHIETDQAVTTAEVALLRGQRTLRRTGPDGNPAEMGGQDVEALGASRMAVGCVWSTILRPAPPASPASAMRRRMGWARKTP